MPDSAVEEEIPPGLEVALWCTQRMAADAAFTTNALLDGYQHQLAKAEATLRAVRRRIEELCSGPYAPSTVALMDALWPTESAIAYWADEPDEGPVVSVRAWEGGRYGGSE